MRSFLWAVWQCLLVNAYAAKACQLITRLGYDAMLRPLFSVEVPGTTFRYSFNSVRSRGPVVSIERFHAGKWGIVTEEWGPWYPAVIRHMRCCLAPYAERSSTIGAEEIMR